MTEAIAGRATQDETMMRQAGHAGPIPLDEQERAGLDTVPAGAANDHSGPRRARWLPIAIGVASIDALVVTTAMLATASGYHRLVFGEIWPPPAQIAAALLAAFLFVAIAAAAGHYRFASLMSVRKPRAVLYAWTGAFLGLFLVLFGAQAGADVSRGTMLFAYPLVLLALIIARELMAPAVTRRARAGAYFTRRILLVGDRASIEAFREDYDLRPHGLSIVACLALDGPTSSPGFGEALAQAVAIGRDTAPDQVVVLVPWSRQERIETIVRAFRSLPVEVQLGPERILWLHPEAGIRRNGPFSALSLVRPPLSLAERLAKRGLDLSGAIAGLILLSPVMLAAAIAIRLDSPGPILFRQPRYGFNKQKFNVYKFRSMRVETEKEGFRQAVAGDSRVTRIGAFLRRTNIDELPQLFNVLRGDMSLVGPRPHLVEHDNAYYDRILDYARRHNMKPGITGWAQVNGFRGRTDTDVKMRARLIYDIYYLDNWSLWLDLRIIFLTVFSRRAFANAV